MNDHIRDTAFGHLLRLISSNRLLKFPDERDPSLCKQSVPSGSVIAPNPQLRVSIGSGSQSSSEPHIDPEQGASPASGICNPSDSKIQNTDPDGAPIEKRNDIILVDWYGPGDQEVRYYDTVLPNA